MSSEKIWVMIPAAGIGSRMQSDIPKQYLEIEGTAILEHTINRFLQHSKIHKIVVALHPNDTHWEKLGCHNHPRIMTTLGGENRVDSVLAGLSLIQKEGFAKHDWVMVHDAARPCLQSQHIDDLIHSKTSSPDGAILAIGAVDTVKIANQHQTVDKTIDRETVWLAQTPQFFPVDGLKRAIEKASLAGALITDESSAMEYAGYHPSLVLGSRQNIKVTEPEDLLLASMWIAHLS